MDSFRAFFTVYLIVMGLLGVLYIYAVPRFKRDGELVCWLWNSIDLGEPQPVSCNRATALEHVQIISNNFHVQVPVFLSSKPFCVFLAYSLQKKQDGDLTGGSFLGDFYGCLLEHDQEGAAGSQTDSPRTDFYETYKCYENYCNEVYKFGRPCKAKQCNQFYNKSGNSKDRLLFERPETKKWKKLNGFEFYQWPNGTNRLIDAVGGATYEDTGSAKL